MCKRFNHTHCDDWRRKTTKKIFKDKVLQSPVVNEKPLLTEGLFKTDKKHFNKFRIDKFGNQFAK